MSATRSATRVSSPDGTIRIYVPGEADKDARKLARSLACRTHGSIHVGWTPDGVKSQRGHTFTFTPVTRTTPQAAPVAVPAPAPAPVASPMAVAVDLLATLPEAVTLALATLMGGAADSRRTEPTPVPEVHDAATCPACKGWGVVRSQGPKAGKAFTTRNGAATAPTATPCTACHGERVTVAPAA